MIRTEFPSFILLTNASSIGSAGSKDRMLRATNGDIVVSLDDDSYPLAPDFCARLLPLFESHPEAAVMCFPELRDGVQFADSFQTDESPGHYVGAYANCAAAMRREVYLSLPGFPEFFVHDYDDPDYALQCYAAGYAVWFEPSLVIRHHRSAVNRTLLKVHFLHSRNELWSVWMRCPWPWIPLVSGFRILRQFQHACSMGLHWVLREPVWWYQALRGIRRCARSRRAIPWSVYYGWMKLIRDQALLPTNVPFGHPARALDQRTLTNS
jgi:GT2 family glycosyltransferase